MASSEQDRERARRWYETHREQARETKRLYNETHAAEISEKRRQRYNALRAVIFRRYGEMCACCGTTENLTIDHINGGGKAHRRSIGVKSAGIPFYRWLFHQYLPSGYQTLCFPCNQAKEEGDRCWLDHSRGAPAYEDQRRARDAARARKRYAADPEAAREYQRQYIDANRERRNEWQRQYNAANRDRVNEGQRRRRAAKKAELA